MWLGKGILLLWAFLRPKRKGSNMTPAGSQQTLLTDIVTGAVKGDFAPEMGSAGRLTQVVLGFVPGVSTLVALRDLIADRQQGDHVGMLLNGLAMIPLVGGVSKIAAVLRAARRMSKAMRAARAFVRPLPTNTATLVPEPTQEIRRKQ
jgi:hypothetical protein